MLRRSPARHDSRNKTTIVFFDEAVAFGGSVVVLSHLVKHIDRTRYVPLVVTSLDECSTQRLFTAADILERYRPKLQYASRLKWMKYCPPGGRFVAKWWSYAFALAASIVNAPRLVKLAVKVRRARPGVIHVNNGAEGLLLSQLLRVPLVWHLHGPSNLLGADKFYARTRTAAFISISRHIAEEASKRGVAPRRIDIVPNPAPISIVTSLSRQEWRGKYGIAQDAVVLAHVGRLVRWKGQIEFLEAFSRIAPACQNAVALIVGDDVEGYTAQFPDEIRQFVREKGLEQRVIFTGQVSNIMELMSYSDVVIHSSIEPEPFGLVIIEGMSAGAAVIAARLGAPIEIVEHGETGLLVNPKDTVEFADALRVLVQDEQYRKRLALAGQAAARERYSPELFARRVEGVYQRVLESSARGGST